MSAVNTKISVIDTQKVLDTLVNKDIFLSCGYGGVIFVEIGSIVAHHFEYEQGKHITRKYGSYRLFCDENWSFSDGKDIHFDRWTSLSQETDDFFESLGIQKLEKIEVINNFEKILFHISGGYTFTIIRDDSIDTFSIVLVPEKKKLTVFGNGDIEFKEYEEDMSYLKKGKPRPKRTETISVDRGFLRNQMPDVLPISFEKVNEFIQPILNQQIQAVDMNSGTRFTLFLGADYRKLLSKKDQKSWHNPMYRWSLTIDEVWILKKGDEIVLDVRQERFRFEEKLMSVLKNKQIIGIHFDKKGSKTHIIFSNEYTLTVLETDRYSRWGMYDRQTGISIASYRDQGLVYRISSPTHLSDIYQTDDVHLDAILYELQFYRDYFAGNNK
jgi:hypothetical protein